ncbi:MAG: putative transrane protein [Hydrocarboniphaga sp.]|uniref:PGPGW domain-containing protein n=1 Tax=Hydrocarboniphaga sp. TaxID=2033016 RepID=UPI0026335A16|nr:PGPGW domain-containing protein [Hydrocarboniphaga sp.]MDB5971036.1 putative transrane protein [Hydrocarboniphaga sp.]
MLDSLKHHWEQFKAHPPGTRFQAQHRRSKTPLARGVRATLAIIVTLIGLVLMPAPGPGMLVVAFGLVLLARESMMAARLLDAAELRARPSVLRLIAWYKRRR